MNKKDKYQPGIKSIQNILAILVMAIGVALLISGSVHVVALCMVAAGVIISLYLIISRARMSEKSKRLSALAKIAIACWAYIPLSIALAMSTSLYGEELQGLANWAMSSLFVGLAAMILTIVELFRTSKN